MNQPIILALIPYLVPSLIGLCVYIYHQVFQRLPKEQRHALEQLATPAVQMVEQVYKNTPSGEKKKIAANTIATGFRAFGLPVPDDAIVNAFIESAVLEMNRLKSVSLTTAPLPQITPPKRFQ